MTQTGFLDRSLSLAAGHYPYVVYVPRDYDPSRAWPIILFLHGAGERGTDGLRATAIGLGSAIRFNSHRVPAIVVFPQCPPDARWLDEPADAAMAALDATLSEFHCDPSRVYLTGLSMGGYGAIHLALAHANRFAAMIVVCGGIFPHPNTTAVRQSPLTMHADDPYAFVAESLKHIPIRLYHGADDPIIPVTESRRLYVELHKRNNDVHYAELPGVGHNAWDAAYSDDALWAWLFSI